MVQGCDGRQWDVEVRPDTSELIFLAERHKDVGASVAIGFEPGDPGVKTLVAETAGTQQLVLSWRIILLPFGSQASRR